MNLQCHHAHIGLERSCKYFHKMMYRALFFIFRIQLRVLQLSVVVATKVTAQKTAVSWCPLLNGCKGAVNICKKLFFLSM